MLFLGGEELLRSWAGDHARNLKRGRGREGARTTLDANVERTFVTALRGSGLTSPERRRGGLRLSADTCGMVVVPGRSRL